MKTSFKPSKEGFKQAEYDFETAMAMFETERYIYTVFMCHLFIEKALKGLFAKKFKEDPPKVHDLIYLVKKIGLTLPPLHQDFLKALNDLSVPTRYPDEIEKLLKQYKKERTEKLLNQTKELAMAKREIIKIKKVLIELLKEIGIYVEKIIIFGFYAKGMEKEDSDIDIIIVSKDFRGKDIFEIVNLTKDVHWKLVENVMKPFDIVYYSDEEWEKGNSLIINSAKKKERSFMKVKFFCGFKVPQFKRFNGR